MPAESTLRIPESTFTVRVSIIDTTFDANIPAALFMGPPISGFDYIHAVAYAFLVTHTDPAGKERSVIFDLGSPKDLEHDFPPAVARRIKGMGGHVVTDKYVSEILTGNGVPLESIEAMIWSHAHFDHVGRPSLFPKTTSLVVGPDVKTSYFPGYPLVENSPILAREFEGREVCELDFSKSDLEIGGLKALDYFGDGSFYLLSAPGHAVGHLNALARTTPNTFIYFGADTFHHGSELRPHPGARLPSNVQLSNLCCPGEALHAIHPIADRSKMPKHYHAAFSHPQDDPNEVPFHSLSQTPSGETLAVDLQAARDTISAVQKFDSDPNIFVVAAHDSSLHGILEYFPLDANSWKEKGWKEEGRWLFLRDLTRAYQLAASTNPDVE